MTDTEVRDEMARRARKAAREKLAEAKAATRTILVIVEGGIVQEVTTAPGQLWNTFDRDDFADAPAEYWENYDEATRAHIRTDWPELYKEIMPRVRQAKAEDRKAARAAQKQEAARAASIMAMN